jgi:heme A synthase
LPHSNNLDRTLADLSLDETYRPYIGMVSFSGESPMSDPRFVEAFRRKVNYGSLALFLLTHPRDAAVALRASLDEAGRQRPALGNFDRSAGIAPYAESQAFAGWSNLKRTLFDRRGSRFFNCFVAVAAVVALLLLWQRRSLPAGGVAAGLILIGMAATELAVSSLADAMEIPRHHLLFYALFDILVIAAVWLVLRRRRPSKMGG